MTHIYHTSVLVLWPISIPSVLLVWWICRKTRIFKHLEPSSTIDTRVPCVCSMNSQNQILSSMSIFRALSVVYNPSNSRTCKNNNDRFYHYMREDLFYKIAAFICQFIEKRGFFSLSSILKTGWVYNLTF